MEMLKRNVTFKLQDEDYTGDLLLALYADSWTPALVFQDTEGQLIAVFSRNILEKTQRLVQSWLQDSSHQYIAIKNYAETAGILPQLLDLTGSDDLPLFENVKKSIHQGYVEFPLLALVNEAAAAFRAFLESSYNA